MTTITKEKKEVIELASDVSAFIKRHGWIARYDPESDELSITAPRLSRNARIRYADDELAFYVTPGNRIEGIFIEYFKSNFVRHHKDLKKIEQKLKNRRSNSLVQLDSDTIRTLTPDLEDALRIILAERLDFNLQVSRK